MDCEQARELVSGEVDGQLNRREVEVLTLHLGGCSSCRGWQSRVLDLTRRERVVVADGKTPTAPTAVLPAHATRNRVVRFALGWAGALLAVWHLPEMLSTGSDLAVHLSRHQAGFATALGVAFIFVALRPDRAYGVIPFVVTFTIVLIFTATLDLVNGSSSLLSESRHLLEIAGLVLVWILGWEMGPRRSSHVRS